jgi:hypothetical protein
MRIAFRATVVAAVVAALGTLVACGSRSDATAPATLPAGERQALLEGTVLGTTLSSLDLLSCSTPAYGSVTKTIGPAGGVMAVGPHTFVVPPLALSKNVAITMTAPKGSNVHVDFEPAGLRFERSTSLTLSYKHCTLPPLLPHVVYVGDRLNILELVPSVFDALTRTVTGKVDHFSGYAIAD